jgi:hypothetical protein
MFLSHYLLLGYKPLTAYCVKSYLSILCAVARNSSGRAAYFFKRLLQFCDLTFKHSLAALQALATLIDDRSKDRPAIV